MPLIRRRRTREASEDPESSEEERPQPRPNQRRRTTDQEGDIQLDDANGDDAGYGSDVAANSSGIQPLARKLCRYALSCEYSRQPIRRADVSTKVLPANGGRVFKQVFVEAQNMLRDVFGMEMVELPSREKVTLQQRRAATQTQSAKSQSTNAWVLVSTLPQKYRTPEIIPPPSIPTTQTESTYTALYTFIVTTIYLHGGRLPESKLERYLHRMNLNRNTPLGTSIEDLMKRLQREQYIYKVVDRSNPGDEVIEWMVGPRGKVEVGEEGASGMVRTVYGSGAEDLEEKLNRSLGLGRQEGRREEGVAATTESAPSGTQARRNTRQTQRRRQESSEAAESEESE